MKNLLLLIAAITLFASPAWAWKPIATTAPQYEDSSGNPYSGAVLKAYRAGTSTNILMATDSTGATTQTSIALNANGYPNVSGTIVIPYIDEAYKLSLYPSQAAADSDTGAIWTLDNITVGITFGESTVTITSNTVLTQTTHCNAQLIVTGTTTLSLPTIESVANNCVLNVYNGGTGSVTLDPDGSETINSASTWILPPNAGGQLVAGSTSDWAFNGSFGIPQTLSAGDIFFHSTTNGLTNLPIGTSGEFLTVASGFPAWSKIEDYSSGTVGDDSSLLFQSSTGTLYYTSAADIIDLVPTASTSEEGLVELATEAEMEFESASKVATADIIRHSPGTAKFWVNFDGTGTVSIRDSFNVASITDNATGTYTVNIADDFADANYAVVAMSGIGSNSIRTCSVGGTPTASTFQIMCHDSANNLADSDYVMVVGYGLQ